MKASKLIIIITITLIFGLTLGYPNKQMVNVLENGNEESSNM